MRLFIHGIGTMTLGVDEPFGQGIACLNDIPIKEYATLAKRRRFGRLTKLFYVAALRALEDAQITDPTTLAIVSSTALGEATAALKLLGQVQKSKGRLLSPNLVPNSVHNAPAGHLTIGINNKMPSITISQGRLSQEAALSASADLLAMSQADKVLVVSGDEAQPDWVKDLEDSGADKWAKELDHAAYQEGAVAFIVGLEPGGRRLGSIMSNVVRTGTSSAGLASILEKSGVQPGKDAMVRIRLDGGHAAVEDLVATALRRSPNSIQLDGNGTGSAQAGAFFDVIRGIDQPDLKELLSLSFELDELAFLHWLR